jgi:hypothetical protein
LNRLNINYGHSSCAPEVPVPNYEFAVKICVFLLVKEKGRLLDCRLPYEESSLKLGNPQEVAVTKGLLDRVEARQENGHHYSSLVYPSF